MKPGTCATTLLLTLLLVAPDSRLLARESEATLDKIARTGEFVVGYRADSSPLSFENKEGQAAGYSVDICRKIAASVNAHFPGKEIKTRFLRISADERISAVVDGKIDIECGATTITLSRQEKVDFSLATFVTGGSVLSLATSGIQDLSDLSGKKVGVAKDTTTLLQLRSHLAESKIDAEIIVVENRGDGMQLLSKGDIDALASDQIVLIGQVFEARDPQRYSIVSEIFSFEPYGFAVRRNDADFRLLVNRVIADLYRSGQHGQIFYNWIGRLGISVPPVVSAMYQLNALPE